MPFNENLTSLFVPTLGDEPTRRFREEPEKEELDDRGETLKSRRDAPGPAVGNTESTKGRPRSHDRTGEPKRVVERGEGGTVGGVGDFGNEQRGSQLGLSQVD